MSSTSVQSTYLANPLELFLQDETPITVDSQQPERKTSELTIIKIDTISSLSTELRADYVKRHYLVDKIGLILSLIALVISFVITNFIAAFLILPLVLGFANMFFMVRKDRKTLVD